VALRTVGVKLVAEVSDYTRNMKQAGQTAKSFAGELGTAAKAGKLDAVADQAAGMGLALAGVATGVVAMRMDFEKSMSAVAAATHAPAKDLDALRGAAIQAGKDTAYSATEAADGITELSKAGIGTTQILNGGLAGALSLAAAGQIDVAEAAETAASAMTQFRLDGSKVPHVADLLAAGAGKAQGSVSDLGQALNQSGLIAAQTGLTIEDTTGTLAAFANAGLTGSDAGTSFKTMLQALQAPSGATKKLMDQLGISAYDTSGKFIGITALADQLKDKLGGLSQAQRDAAMAQIFGSDAVRAASILYREGASGVQAWIDKTNDAGYAATTAAKLTDNLAGDIERLKGSLETMAIEAGGGATSGLRVLAQSANALVDQVSSLPPYLSSTATVLAAVGGATLLLGAGWVKLRRSTAEMLSELRSVGPGGERAASALQTTTKWAGRAAAAFAVYEVASAAVSATQKDLSPQIEALGQGLETYATTGQLAGESSRLLGDGMDKLKGKFQFLADDSFKSNTVQNLQGGLEALIPGLKGTDESLTRTKERVTALDQAMAQMVQGGKAGQAQAAFDKLAQELAVGNVSMDEFKKQFPQYAAAVEVAGKATTTTAAAVDDLGTSANTSADELEKLTKALAAAFDAQMSVDRATIKLQESTVSLTKELGEGKRTLALNSEEGRKNRSAVLDQLEAIESLRTARVNEGVSIDEAGKKYIKDIEGLRKSMIQAGFSKQAVNDLIGAYKNIPKTVNTQINTPNLAASDKAVKDYGKRMNDLARYIKTTVSVEGRERAQKELEKLLILQEAAQKGISVSAAASAYRKNAGYHDGGWTGPGGEYEPAGVVHGDEFVIKKASRRKIEAKSPGLLEEMNATGQVPGYAGGGRVIRMPFPVTAAKMDIPSRAEALAKVIGDFGNWPSSPGAQRGDSGVWHKVVALIKSTGPVSGEFGNAYRPGDPLWHGSGRAVDWMGYNQDALATFLAGKHPLELIHRTRNRDYAYTRGRDKGSFNNALMEAHRNHVHIAMQHGGTITEPIFGVGASGRSYSFGENYQPERVTPMTGASAGGGGITIVIQNHGVIASQYEAENWLASGIDKLKSRGRI
jgi:TP901 family phage tail tape measure protein